MLDIMMPSAPISMMMTTANKPKIGFSIDSIVGNRKRSFSSDNEGSETPLSPLSDLSYHQQRSPRIPTSPAEIHRALRLNEYTQKELHNRIIRAQNSPTKEYDHRILSHDSIKENQQINRQHSPASPQSRLTPEESINRRSRSPSPLAPQKPIMVPGIPANLIRPSPVGPPGMPDMNNMQNMQNIQNIQNIQNMRSQMPPYPNEMVNAAQNHFFRLGTSKLQPP